MHRDAAASLETFLGERVERYGMIAQDRDVDGGAQDRALELVREFIIKRGLILYGGLAIDYALRLKGSQIYPDKERPDYDFFSPRSVHDAYDLADLLQQRGFKNVSAIKRIHVQTMGVRIDYVDVADISYAPPDVFEELPTVTFRGMKVLHPDYQRTDMHLAFSFPFLGPPREAVFHRFPKDLRRFNLFEQYYPITVGKELAGGGLSAATKGNKMWRRKVPLPQGGIPFAVHGLAAYALYCQAFDALLTTAQKAGVEPRSEWQCQRHGVTVLVEREALTLEATTNVDLGHPVLVSPDPEKVMETLAAAHPDAGGKQTARVTWFEPYMDSRPPSGEISGLGEDFDALHVHSTRNRRIAISVIKKGVPPVVSPQYLLMYLLYEAHMAALRGHTGARDLYVQYYRHTLNLLGHAGEIFQELKRRAHSSLNKLINTSPFGLTTRTVGDVNHDVAYLINIAGAAQKVGDEPPFSVPPLEGLPTNYYPGQPKFKKQGQPSFDYNANPLFRRSGKPTERFIPWY